MTGFLLDTNVLSELIKPRPNPRVTSWIRDIPPAYLSVLTLGEVTRGARGLRRRDPVRAERLDAWIRRLRIDYASHTLPIDIAVIDRWAALPTARTLRAIDSLIGATALAHGLTVATRNTRDFADAGVPTYDPFA